jgi:hypothetical protein
MNKKLLLLGLLLFSGCATEPAPIETVWVPERIVTLPNGVVEVIPGHWVQPVYYTSPIHAFIVGTFHFR